MGGRTYASPGGLLLLSLMFLGALTGLVGCGAAVATGTTPEQASISTGSTSFADALQQARAQDYLDQAGAVGPISEEDVACAQALKGETVDSSGKVIIGADGKLSVSTALKNRIHNAYLATKQAHADWNTKQSPMPQLNRMHTLTVQYLAQAESIMEHMDAGVQAGDPYEILQGSNEMQEAEATRQQIADEFHKLLAQLDSGS